VEKGGRGRQGGREAGRQEGKGEGGEEGGGRERERDERDERDKRPVPETRKTIREPSVKTNRIP
jgi:hypothetical protein